MNGLYCDGGVIQKNPSRVGGTWAWVRVEDDREVARLSGVLQPVLVGADTVSNNNSELYALLEGIVRLPDGWTGMVYSDSKIALGWYFWRYKLDNVPATLQGKLVQVQQDATRRGIVMIPVLLGGHPTKADLAAGIRKKEPRLPVSRWNVLCDEMCGKRGRLHLLSLQSANTVSAPGDRQTKTEATGE